MHNMPSRLAYQRDQMGSDAFPIRRTHPQSHHTRSFLLYSPLVHQSKHFASPHRDRNRNRRSVFATASQPKQQRTSRRGISGLDNAIKSERTKQDKTSTRRTELSRAKASTHSVGTTYRVSSVRSQVSFRWFADSLVCWFAGLLKFAGSTGSLICWIAGSLAQMSFDQNEQASDRGDRVKRRGDL